MQCVAEIDVKNQGFSLRNFWTIFIEERSLYIIYVLLWLGAQANTDTGIHLDAFHYFPFQEIFFVILVFVLGLLLLQQISMSNEKVQKEKV